MFITLVYITDNAFILNVFFVWLCFVHITEFCFFSPLGLPKLNCKCGKYSISNHQNNDLVIP